MEVGAELIARARAAGRESIALIGTAKSVGKTVTIAALCAALAGENAAVGLTSIGRREELSSPFKDSMEPRLFLREGTLLTTARASSLACPAAAMNGLNPRILTQARRTAAMPRPPILACSRAPVHGAR